MLSTSGTLATAAMGCTCEYEHRCLRGATVPLCRTCFRLGDGFWCRIVAAPSILIQAKEIIGIIIYNCAISENYISVTVVIDLEKGYKLT